MGVHAIHIQLPQPTSSDWVELALHKSTRGRGLFAKMVDVSQKCS
jgi:hypothetical protein